MKKVVSFLIIAIAGFTFISQSKAQVYTSYSYSYYSPYEYDFPIYVTDVIHNNYYGYQVVDAVSFYNGPQVAFGVTLVRGGSYYDVVIDHYGRVVNRVAYHTYPQTHVWVNYFPHRRDVVYYYPRGHRNYNSYKHVYVNRGYHKNQYYYYDRDHDRNEYHQKGNNHRKEYSQPERNRNSHPGHNRVRYANIEKEKTDNRNYTSHSRNSRTIAENRNVQQVRNRGGR